MKTKLTAIFVCIMMMATVIVVSVAENVGDEKLKIFSNDIKTTAFDDDVPTWSKGTTWTYRVDDIDIELGLEGQPVHIHGKIESLPFEVVDDTGNSYQLTFKSKTINGDFNVDIDLDYLNLGEGAIKINGELLYPTLQGNIVLRKSDLGIEDIDIQISGILRINIEEQPFIPLPIDRIPIPARISLTANSDNPFTFLDFPLSNGKSWGLPSATISVDGEIKSIWLNVLKFVNRIAGLLGMELLPPEIAALLPVIDIMDTLEQFGLAEYFNEYLDMDEYPDVFTCLNQETITVEAGTYNAYNISVMQGLGNIYYAPEVGNIIKISGHYIDAELIKVYNV